MPALNALALGLQLTVNVRIARDRLVTIGYTMRLAGGRIVEARESLTYLHGYGRLLPALERALNGALASQVLDLVLRPDEAYGDRDPTGVFVVPRTLFPPSAVAGQTYSVGAHGRLVPLRIVEVMSDCVQVDGNHPLAGETLHIRVVVQAVRLASHAALVRAAS